MPETPPPFWSLKPWWCQPWSILLTGALVIAGSWWLLKLWWITAPLALGVLLWWGLFLLLVPSAYRAGMADGDPPSPD
jgi:hypothetical protein